MVPTIPHNESKTPLAYPMLFISKFSARGHNVGVGDVITYTIPMGSGVGCKRIVGMPGDLVCVVSRGRESEDIGKVGGDFATYGDEMIRVPEGHCWLAGDNLEWSRDSRTFGPLPLALIKGKVIATIWPVSAWKWFRSGGLTDLQEDEPEVVVK